MKNEENYQESLNWAVNFIKSQLLLVSTILNLPAMQRENHQKLFAAGFNPLLLMYTPNSYSILQYDGEWGLHRNCRARIRFELASDPEYKKDFEFTMRISWDSFSGTVSEGLAQATMHSELLGKMAQVESIMKDMVDVFRNRKYHLNHNLLWDALDEFNKQCIAERELVAQHLQSKP